MQERQVLVTEVEALSRRLQAASTATAQAEAELASEQARSQQATQVGMVMCMHCRLAATSWLFAAVTKPTKHMQRRRAAYVKKPRQAHKLKLLSGLHAFGVDVGSGFMDVGCCSVLLHA